jgi:lysozyme
VLAQQVSELMADEGLRLTVYDDATGRPIGPGCTLSGHPTVGWGRALDVHGISAAEAALLLINDLAPIEARLAHTYPWFSRLDPVRQGVLCNLAYNLGLRGLGTFHFMLADLAAGDYAGAADELVNSRWIRQVQHSRSSRLIEQLRTGTLTTATDTPDMSGTFYPNTILGGGINVNLMITLDPGTRALLAGLLGQFTTIQQELSAMSGTTDSITAELQNLQQTVANASGVEQSAMNLIQGIPALIQAAVQQAQANGATPQQLQAFADLNTQLQQNTQTLADAVAQQQPAPAPAPAPAPTPAPAPGP